MNGQCQIRADALDAYLHDLLNDVQHGQLEQHLTICTKCRLQLSALAAESEAISKCLRQIEVPPMRMSLKELIVLHGPPKESSPAIRAAAERVEWRDRLSNKTKSIAARVMDKRTRVPLISLAAILFLMGCVGVLWSNLSAVKSAQQAALQRENALMDQVAQLQAQRVKDAERAGERTRNDSLEMLAIHRRHEVEMQDTLNKTVGALQAEIARLSTEISAQKQQISAANLQNEKEKAEKTAEIKQEELDFLRKRIESLQNGDRDPGRAAVQVVPTAPPPPPGLHLFPDETASFRIGAPEAIQVSTVPTLLFNGERKGWVRQLAAVNMQEDLSTTEKKREKMQRIMSSLATFASPAASRGRVFVGNGMASNNVVSFDGLTGKDSWEFRADDNGAGPPVLTEDGTLVTFTTESCTLYALDTGNGKKSWSRYLGAHAWTQPAIAGQRVFVVHDSGSGNGIGDTKHPFSLSCLDLARGTPLWSKGLPDDAVSAPTIDNGKVYLSTRDGSVWVFNSQNGSPIWSQQCNAISAPVLSGNDMYVSTWSANRFSGFEESLMACGKNHDQAAARLFGPVAAPYLLPVTVAETDITELEGYESHGSFNKMFEDKVLTRALSSAAQPALANTWCHLGSRPTIVENRAYVTMGNQCACIDMRNGKTAWNLPVDGFAENTSALGKGQPPLTPPSYAAGKLYMGSVWGDMLCLDAESGSLLWRYRLKDSGGIVSQIVLDQGRAYATTRDGALICVDTGDKRATGWASWGGSPGHNSVAKKTIEE